MDNKIDFSEAYAQFQTDNAPLFNETITAAESKGMDSSQITAMLEYIKQMNETIAESTKHITVMECQLAEMQEIQKHPVKHVLHNIHERLKSCLEKCKEGVRNLMTKVVEGCKGIVESARDSGIVAKDNVAKFFDVKGVIETNSTVFQTINQLCEKAVKNTETFCAEAGKIGGHVNNMGRAVIGRDTVAVGDKPPGVVAQILTLPYKGVSRLCKAVIALDAKNLENLENASQRADAVREYREVVKTEKTIVESAAQSAESGVISKDAAAELRDNSAARVKQSRGSKNSFLSRLNAKDKQAKHRNLERDKSQDKSKAVPEVG
jgi:hypothetical protein